MRISSAVADLGMKPTLTHRVRTVAIADCVHYCAFQYGRGAFNPYENYIVGLERGTPIDVLRGRFVDFIRCYRPHDLGEALGVTTLVPVPLWLLPWKSWRKLWRPGAWCRTPQEVPDILTHFCEQGVLQTRIDEEFCWLERAWTTIRTRGYCPDQYGYIEVLELHRSGTSAYLVLDGNHRLSALAALGVVEVAVRQARWNRIDRHLARFWPLVLSGHIACEDALKLFDAYFSGQSQPMRAAVPAAILKDTAGVVGYETPGRAPALQRWTAGDEVPSGTLGRLQS